MPPHLPVLRVPEGQITVLAVFPAKRQELADASARDHGELQQRLQLRHLQAGVEEPPLLIW
jgi:hypothetical protein